MRTCVSILLVLTAACNADTFHPGDEPDSGTPDNLVGGGDGGVAQDVSAPPGCDTTKLPTDDQCVVNDAQGIFVSASMGSQSGDGTRAHPKVSLADAIEAAKTVGRRVYACAETYNEAITLEDGVSVFGYFECASGWTVSSTAHAKVASPTSPAAKATNIAKATRVEALDIVAPDFTTGSQSSIALFATSSSGLTIKNARVHAGTGGRGADGTSGIQLVDSTNTKNGQGGDKDGVCTGGNCTLIVAINTGQTSGGTNTCNGATGHDGGPGGAGGYPGEFQSLFDQNYLTQKWQVVGNNNTTAGFPTTATSQTAQGGAVGNPGSAGANGADGTNGVSGASANVLSASDYVPADGTNGTDGQPGQGGGGAGANSSNLQPDYPASNYPNKYGWGEEGAAGGAGGCPGLAGSAGKGGGASIAVVALGAALTLDTVTVESSNGGDGGAAGLPSTPTNGGMGGIAGTSATRNGGNGGNGGLAGVSGNGGGGPSVGLAYDKVTPTMLACPPVKVGAGGNGVSARTVNGQTIPASANGMSADTYMFNQ